MEDVADNVMTQKILIPNIAVVFATRGNVYGSQNKRSCQVLGFR